MFDPQKLLEQFLGGAPADGKAKSGLSPDMVKGLAGGAAAGGLAALLLGSKGGQKLAKSALKVGGTAVLGGLAYKAWQDWQASRNAATTAPSGPAPMKDVTPATPLLQAPKEERDRASLAVIGAMIAAAKSDGHIDAAEQQKIFARLDAYDLDVEAKAFVMDELRKPLDIDAIVRSATSPELAAEIYAASLLAVDPDDPAEQAYLAMLAARLKLDPGLRANLDAATAKALA